MASGFKHRRRIITLILLMVVVICFYIIAKSLAFEDRLPPSYHTDYPMTEQVVISPDYPDFNTTEIFTTVYDNDVTHYSPCFLGNESNTRHYLLLKFNITGINPNGMYQLEFWARNNSMILADTWFSIQFWQIDASWNRSITYNTNTSAPISQIGEKHVHINPSNAIKPWFIRAVIAIQFDAIINDTLAILCYAPNASLAMSVGVGSNSEDVVYGSVYLIKRADYFGGTSFLITSSILLGLGVVVPDTRNGLDCQLLTTKIKEDIPLSKKERLFYQNQCK